VSFLTARFATAHPAAQVEIRSMTSRAIERALEAFEIDAGVTYLENEPLQNVRKVPLYRERYVFVVRRDHPAAAGPTIGWKEAAAADGYPLGERGQQTGNRPVEDRGTFAFDGFRDAE